jgi:hypothetical protein
MDFLHGPGAQTKLALWERGIARAGAQHPYAGLLIRRHATLLYAGSLDHIRDHEERTATLRFIEAWPAALHAVRMCFADVPEMVDALRDASVEAHTRLLQFGDMASLQLCVLWSDKRTIAHCPVDRAGACADITLRHEADTVVVDPWPFGVNHFSVTIHGRVLAQRTFASHAAYRAALEAAPLQELCWHIVPT